MVEIWDRSHLRLLGVLDGHLATVDVIAFSPDGTRLASVAQDGATRLWDVEDFYGEAELSVEESDDDERFRVNDHVKARIENQIYDGTVLGKTKNGEWMVQIGNVWSAVVPNADLERRLSEEEIQHLRALKRTKRGWGEEQAVGPPDTESAGDYRTAWAAESSNENAWLLLEFEREIDTKGPSINKLPNLL